MAWFSSSCSLYEQFWSDAKTDRSNVDVTSATIKWLIYVQKVNTVFDRRCRHASGIGSAECIVGVIDPRPAAVVQPSQWTTDSSDTSAGSYLIANRGIGKRNLDRETRDLTCKRCWTWNGQPVWSVTVRDRLANDDTQSSCVVCVWWTAGLDGQSSRAHRDHNARWSMIHFVDAEFRLYEKAAAAAPGGGGNLIALSWAGRLLFLCLIGQWWSPDRTRRTKALTISNSAGLITAQVMRVHQIHQFRLTQLKPQHAGYWMWTHQWDWILWFDRLFSTLKSRKRCA